MPRRSRASAPRCESPSRSGCHRSGRFQHPPGALRTLRKPPPKHKRVRASKGHRPSRETPIRSRRARLEFSKACIQKPFEDATTALAGHGHPDEVAPPTLPRVLENRQRPRRVIGKGGRVARRALARVSDQVAPKKQVWRAWRGTGGWAPGTSGPFIARPADRPRSWKVRWASIGTPSASLTEASKKRD